jgi:mannose-6-phosphate isomerase-like protein (cupin superfamily)
MTKTVKKPWGQFELFSSNEKTTVKIITVSAKKKLSLQYHMQRSEFWRVIDGSGDVIIGNKRISAKKGDIFTIPRKTLHRIMGGPKGMVILEIAKGNFDEKDIVRIEDDFGRI